MLLALDIGNTNIVAGVFDGAKLLVQWRIATQRDRTADEMAVFLSTSFQLGGLAMDQIDGVAIASVVPSLTPQAAQLARRYFNCEPLILGPQTDTGLTNAYDNPADVGADRLVNALAAWTKFGSAAVIVDFGTATTVDAVSSRGHYLGGAIAPGLQISIDALFKAAARLTRVELTAPPSALGRNPTHSLRSGIVFGYAGMVKELVLRCTAEVRAQEPPDAPIAIIATGGLAELIGPQVPAIAHIEPQLTLEGLRLLWERHRS